MAKLNGFGGKAVGKVGNFVYSINSGVQIVKEYNSEIANPNTVPQVNQRARLKLASQLAAAYADVIAIPKQGLVSSRNLFIKRNFNFITAGSGVAQVSYENLQLTAGNQGLPAVTATRDSEVGTSVELAESASVACDRIVYNIFKKSSEGQLQLAGSKVVSTAGDDGKFAATLPYVTGDICVYAYGIKDKHAQAAAVYGNYSVESGVDVARLLSNRTISTADASFTQTRGTTLFQGENEAVSAGDGEVMVYITAQGPGSVSGAGFTNGRKAVALNSSVTVTATPATNATFAGWKLNGGSTYLSTSAEYTFTATNLTDLIAVFNGTGGNNDDPNNSED